MFLQSRRARKQAGIAVLFGAVALTSAGTAGALFVNASNDFETVKDASGLPTHRPVQGKTPGETEAVTRMTVDGAGKIGGGIALLIVAGGFGLGAILKGQKASDIEESRKRYYEDLERFGSTAPTADQA